MFAIGVGKGVDHQELSDIASDPEDQFKFIVDDFNALSSITEMLAERPCPGTTIVVAPALFVFYTPDIRSMSAGI